MLDRLFLFCLLRRNCRDCLSSLNIENLCCGHKENEMLQSARGRGGCRLRYACFDRFGGEVGRVDAWLERGARIWL